MAFVASRPPETSTSHLSLLAAHHAKSAAEFAAGQNAMYGLLFIHKGMSDS
jgi:hypothetical protein